MGVKATTIAVWALISFTAVTPVLGGLYLYMNRFEYLHVEPLHVRINKLTGERCIIHWVELSEWVDPWTCTQPGQN
jgi:hypothetical protein